MATKWYYQKGEHKHGPIESGVLIRLASSGQLRPHDFVWKAGMKTWTAASLVKGLSFPVPAPLAPHSEPSIQPRPMPRAVPAPVSPTNTVAQADFNWRRAFLIAISVVFGYVAVVAVVIVAPIVLYLLGFAAIALVGIGVAKYKSHLKRGFQFLLSPSGWSLPTTKEIASHLKRGFQSVFAAITEQIVSICIPLLFILLTYCARKIVDARSKWPPVPSPSQQHTKQNDLASQQNSRMNTRLVNRRPGKAPSASPQPSPVVAAEISSRAKIETLIIQLANKVADPIVERVQESYSEHNDKAFRLSKPYAIKHPPKDLREKARQELLGIFRKVTADMNDRTPATAFHDALNSAQQEWIMKFIFTNSAGPVY
jgi:GYF domain 2